jgi:hypothetical protein
VNPLDRAVSHRGEEARILPSYRRGIGGCLRRDAHETSAVGIELILTLNYEYEEATGELVGRYDLCRRKVKTGRFDVVGQSLHDLGVAWTDSILAR